MKFRLKDCRVKALHIYPKGENGPNQVLEVIGLLTPPIAEKLKIRDACYSAEGIPLNYESYSAPALRIDGADISLDDKDFRATMIHKFKVHEPGAKGKKGVSLELSLLIHLDKKQPVKFWLDKQNTDEFTFGLNARQQDLSFGDEAAEDDEEQDSAEADSAAAEDEETDTGCVACNNKIPMGVGPNHVTGAKCTNPENQVQGAPEPTKGPSLASAREAAGGTHQRGAKRSRAPRNAEAEAYSDGSAPDQTVN